MFSFLTPLFLWAAIAATIPLVLHLIQSRRSVRVPFSTIRFLKLAESRSSRRIKMENFILWLLRTLLILFLVLAFAMPMLRTTGLTNLLRRAHRDIAIVLDTSYSMNYRTGRETVWDQAIESAVAMIEGLTDHDRVCVFLAGKDVTPLVEQLSSDREGTIARLKHLRPAHDLSRLGPALMAANDALKEEARRREREIHIITDGQSLPWNSFERWDAGTLVEHATVFVSLLGVTNPENTSPIKVTLDPPVIMADMPVRVGVGLAGSGAARDTIVSLVVDGEEVDRRAIVQGDGADGDTIFTIPPLGPGVHTAYIETPEDNLPLDDTLHFLVRTREHLPALCVGSADATLFLRLALGAAADDEASGISLKTITPDALSAEPLSSYACIFLCDALPLPGQEIVQMEQYVQGGGLLVLWPGSGARVEDYAPWRCLPGTVSEIIELPIAERTQLLRWNQPTHPLLHPLRQGLGTPRLTMRRHLGWTELAEETEVLVTANAATPFVLSRPYGRGHVFVLSVSANRSWSDFPLSPYFLPLAHQFVQYAAGMGRFTPYLWTTDSLLVGEHLSEATTDSTLRSPKGDKVALRSSTVEGATVLHAEALFLPGIYTLSTPSQPDPRPALAINLTRRESDLTPIVTDEIPDRMGLDEVILSQNQEELLRKIEEHRIGRTFGEALLWLALIVAVAEGVYGNMLVRGVPKLSETLGITAAGKVGGA